MPLLDLECEECSEVFEVLVLGEERPVCPVCGAGEVRRLYSPISPPKVVRLSRGQRRDSDLRRSEREAARKERFVEQRRKGRKRES